MSYYSLAKFFSKLIYVSLLTCTLCFSPEGILFFLASWHDHYAMAATNENGSGFHADQADFNKSQIRCLETKVRELDILSYEIILRNTGSRRPEYVVLGYSLTSDAAMLASASPNMVYDNRYLRWQGNVDPGEERHFTVKLITLPGSYDNLITSNANISWDGSEKNIPVEAKVLLPEKTSLDQFLFIAGGIGFKWLEVMIIGYLLIIPLFLFVVLPLIRWREKQRFERSPDVSWPDDDPHQIKFKAMAIALLLSLAFMPLFISEVIDDIRQFVSYEKTTCTILDKKAGGLPGSRGSHPILAVRYVAGGKEIISAGSLAKGASIQGTSAEQKIALYDYGKSYTCWFNPNDPKKFVLHRGDITWGLYLLFLPPLVLALVASRYFLRRLRGAGTPHERLRGPIKPG